MRRRRTIALVMMTAVAACQPAPTDLATAPEGSRRNHLPESVPLEPTPTPTGCPLQPHDFDIPTLLSLLELTREGRGLCEPKSERIESSSTTAWKCELPGQLTGKPAQGVNV